MKTWTLASNLVLLTALLGYGLYQRTRAKEPEPIIPVREQKVRLSSESPSEQRRPSRNPENAATNNVSEVGADVAGFRDWEKHLTRFMSERGFSDHEISRMAAILGERLKAETIDDAEIGAGIQETARELKFDSGREEMLASAVYFALAESSGSISFQTWDSCLQQKLNDMNASACLREISQQLGQQIRQQIDGDAITLSQTQSLSSLQNEAVDRAVQDCGSELEVVGPLLSFDAAPCR